MPSAVPSPLPSKPPSSHPTPTPSLGPSAGPSDGCSVHRLAATSSTSELGTQIKAHGEYVTFIDDGDYLSYGPIDFGSDGTKYYTMTISYDKANAGFDDDKLDILVGSQPGTGVTVSTFSVNNDTRTGGWEYWRQVELELSNVTPGSQDLTIKLSGRSRLVNLDWIELFPVCLLPNEFR
jgi:hypothetical protein